MDHVTSTNHGSKQVVLMAFGLPVMTTAIVMGSMYAGHVMTTRSDRPTNVLVSAAAPNIDVNVPQAPPPNVQVSAPPATVDVHVPQGLPPTVTINTPQSPAPNITVNPSPASVTIIERREENREPRVAEKSAPPVNPLVQVPFALPVSAGSNAPVATSSSGLFVAPQNESAKSGDIKSPATTSESTAPSKNETAPVKPADPLKPAADASSALKTIRESLKTAPEKEALPAASGRETSEAAPILVSHQPNALLSLTAKPEDLSLDTLYHCATQYIDAYCQKNGLDAANEERKWNKTWRVSVEQAIADNIDSTEQSYINRIVIAKRDYFNIEKASPEKIVEACRIMLRYRDGQLAWLSAMKEALTEDNLKKTVAFLAAGPK